MHTINPLNFGSSGIGVSFYNGTSVLPGYIVKQYATNKFVVTDGTVMGNPIDDTHTKRVSLAPTTDIATDLASNPDFFTIPIEPTSAASGGSFTAHYKVSVATALSSSGTHWNVSDSLALPSGAGALTVASLSGGNIATVTVGTPGDYTTLFSTPTTGTRAAGSGGTFTTHYAVDSALIVAGGAASAAGYSASDVLTLATSGSATIIVDTVDGGGGILTYHVGAVGNVTALGVTRAVTGGGGTGATFNLKWKVLSVASSGGSGYNVGDTLTFAGMTSTSTPTASITTATSHAATAVTVGSAGAGITVAASSITTSTTTATFTLKYQLLSVASSGGTGYAVNDLLNFNGMTAVEHPVAHISTATSTAATAVTVDDAGTDITVAATSVNTGGDTEYICRIWFNKVLTTAGNTYHWTRDSSENGSAVIHDFDY